MKRTKHTIDERRDMQYVDTLTGDDAVWMDVYLRATLSYDSDALAILLTPLQADKQQALQRKIWGESDARRRDLMNVGVRTYLIETEDGSEEPETLGPVLHKPRCVHCYRTECRCKGKRQRFPRYSPLDYQNR